MPIAFMILGFMLVGAGLYFAVKNIASANAGAEAAKSFSVSGPSWLILVAIGAGVIVFGGWQFKEQHPTVVPVVETTEVFEPFAYGDDPDLDVLYDACEAQDMQACDDLFQFSPRGSDYELFGATCGFLLPEPDDLFCIESDPTKLPHSD